MRVGEFMEAVLVCTQGRMAILFRQTLHDLVVKKRAIRLFCLLEDALHRLVIWLESLALKPKDDVGFARHRPNLDDLFHTEIVRWHSGIDGICQLQIVLAEGFYHRSSVHAGSRSEERRVGKE